MNTPAKIGRPLVEECRAKREELLQAFCALENMLSAVLGPDSPKVFSQKIGRLSTKQLSAADAKSLVASRNLVAHAEIVPASLASKSVAVWRVPHAELQLNARVMTRHEFDQWYSALSKEIEQLRATVQSLR